MTGQTPPTPLPVSQLRERGPYLQITSKLIGRTSDPLKERSELVGRFRGVAFESDELDTTEIRRELDVALHQQQELTSSETPPDPADLKPDTLSCPRQCLVGRPHATDVVRGNDSDR